MTETIRKDVVRVRVVKHLPQGLSVEMENGQRGIVRVREISWNEKKIADRKSIYYIGWVGNAALIPSQKGEVQELSLRLAESDPWDDFLERHEPSHVYEGIVTSVVEYGAFIEIYPGITGLLHQSQLPAWGKTAPLDLFWPGDKAFVTIRQIDRQNRQVNLSLPEIKLLDVGEALEDTLPTIVSRDTDSVLDKLLGGNAPQNHILLVENEPLQAMAVSGWLTHLGQRTDVVDSAERAMDFLERTQPDIALVDIGLPEMSGTDLAYHILEKYPSVRVVNITDWAHANDIMDTLEDLHAKGATHLLKPLLPEEDLVPLILHKNGEDIAGGEGGAERLSLSGAPKLDKNQSIQVLLSRCKSRLGFDHVILFSLDPIHRQAVIVERVGDGTLNKNAMPYVIYSPVRDVAEDHETVVVHEIKDREQNRFRYLLELCPSMTACIGVPVFAETSFDYALFVLDHRPRKITNEHQLFVEGIALAIGSALEQNNLREKFVLMQRTALIGHLTRAMMHEINNLVGPLLYVANNLKRSLEQVEKETEPMDYESVNKDIASIQQDIRKIITTTRTFGRIVAKGRQEVIRVDEIVYETISLLRDISDRAHVFIQFTPPDSLIVVRSQGVVLEQIFLNVTLNAIQQIMELRPNTGGWVKINMETVSEGKNESVCRMFIEDNGPGIHANLWEKVFEAGFTTREDGSGIGLYISRNLIEDLGGKVYISKSHILSGTSFTLEFPIRV